MTNVAAVMACEIVSPASRSQKAHNEGQMPVPAANGGQKRGLGI